MKIIISEQQLKELITEGRYSQTIRQISMDIMKEVMTFIKSDDEDMEWEDNYVQETFHEKDDEEGDEEIFSVKLNLTKNDSDLPYDIDAAYDFDDEEEYINYLEFNIDINPDLFIDKQINKFLAELKDAIRHEIEHLYQSENPNKSVKHKKSKTLGQEVLTPKELPAYIQGFFTQAKTRKMYMDDIIDEWAEERKNNFKNKKEIDKVKDKLIEFGKKLLPQAKWKN